MITAEKKIEYQQRSGAMRRSRGIKTIYVPRFVLSESQLRHRRCRKCGDATLDRSYYFCSRHYLEANE